MPGYIIHINKKVMTITIFVMILLWIMYKPASVNAQESFSEYEVKAGFIYNFTKFVEWPADAFSTTNSPFVVVVVGDTLMRDILDKVLSQRSIKGRTTVILYAKNLHDIPNCNVLFIGNSQKSNLRPIINKFQSKPTLLIGNNYEEFCQLGGMINFSSRITKHGFEINQAGLERSGLIISAKLLSLAQLVKEYNSVEK